MFLIGAFFSIFVLLLLETFVLDVVRYESGTNSLTNDSNVNITITDLFLDAWLRDQPQSDMENDETSAKGSRQRRKGGKHKISSRYPRVPTDWEGFTKTVYHTVQNGNQTEKSRMDVINSLFNIPRPPIEPDWSVVLGSFDYFKNENWGSFLLATDVPFFLRVILNDASERVTIKRKPERRKKVIKGQGKKKSLIKQTRLLPPGHPMSIESAVWFVSHVSRFFLGEPCVEHDPDGTDSVNTFYFIAPRVLVHRKIKPRWTTTIIRHFGEKELNMTVLEREHLVAARRFYHRIT